MYNVGIESKQAFLLLAPLQGAVNDAKMQCRPLLGDAFSSTHHRARTVARSVFGHVLEHREVASLDLATRVLSWYSGMDIIGCGAEALVTRRGDKVVKYAHFPAYDPREVADELKRRFDIAQATLGGYILDTLFEAGSRDGDTPSSVVMVQQFVDIVGDAQLDPIVDPQIDSRLGEFKELAQKLAHDSGILVDVCLGRSNLACIGGDVADPLVLVDGSLVSKSDHGKPMLIAKRYIVDAHKVEADIHNLRVAV